MRCRAHLFVSTRLGNVFTVALLIHDYERFQLHEVELQTSIRIEDGFEDLLRLATLRLFVPPIVSRVQPKASRDMLTWRHPHLPLP